MPQANTLLFKNAVARSVICGTVTSLRNTTPALPSLCFKGFYFALQYFYLRFHFA